MTRVPLNTTEYGDPSLPPLVFCHGLFGQGRNWTSIAKRAATYFRVVLLDMPNHGRSGWTDHFEYLDQAQIVVNHLLELDRRPWRIVGHSMGGKIAMLLALLRPGLVERLVVVDMSPVSYNPPISDLNGYAQAMLEMDLSTLTRREDADERLAPVVHDPTVRAFLLQNLRREGGSWAWQMNLELLAASMPALGDWPDVTGRTDLPGLYEGPVLWVKGANSPYILDEYDPAMRTLFPATRLISIKNAGHWVHSEQPEVFRAVLRHFLEVQDFPEVDDEDEDV